MTLPPPLGREVRAEGGGLEPHNAAGTTPVPSCTWNSRSKRQASLAARLQGQEARLQARLEAEQARLQADLQAEEARSD